MGYIELITGLTVNEFKERVLPPVYHVVLEGYFRCNTLERAIRIMMLS